MRKGQRKVNIAGSASCISLLLLAFLLVNPLIGNSANALEGEESEVSPQATTISDVNISFSPTSGSASMTPVTEEGAKARTSVKVNVSISNSGGYSVYLSSNTPGLVGKNSGEIIAGIDGSSTFDNLQTNTWGYAVTEEEELSESALYKSMSQGQGDLLATGSERSVSYNFLLSFAAKIGNTKPADTYENEVTLSVVSSPLEITLVPVYNEFSIDYMQEMTSAICDNAAVGTTGQLYDRRDNKPYWVTKLADGNCWMTQNLALDLSANKDLTPEDSDVLGDWRPEFSTTTNLRETGSTVAVYTGTRSWSQPGYVLNTPYEIRIGKDSIVDLSDGESIGLVGFGLRFAATDPDFYSKSSYLGLDGVTKCSKEANTAISTATSGTCAQYDAHYVLGNYYQWNAATAGSGEDLIQNPSYSAPSSVADLKNAASSICPAGWQLPVDGKNGSSVFNQNDSFGKLLQAYGWSSIDDSNLLVKKPIFLTRSGNIYNGQSNGNIILGIKDLGKAGVYWTASSQQPNNTCPFNYSINGNGIVNAADSYGWAYSGASVRCIAR